MTRFAKLFCFILSFILVGASTVTAQEAKEGYKLSKISTASGEDAVSSGITLTVQFKDDDTRLDFQFQSEIAQVIWGPEWKRGRFDGIVAGSAGAFQGAPWVGPYLELNYALGEFRGQKISVGTVQWPFLFVGIEPRSWREENDGVENPEKLLVGYFGNVGLNVGQLSLTYAKLNLLDDPWNTIPGVSFTQKIGKGFDVTVAVSRNMNKKELMYYTAVVWKPSAK